MATEEYAPCWPVFWLCKTIVFTPFGMCVSVCTQHRCVCCYVWTQTDCLSLISRNHQTAATPLWRMKMWKVRLQRCKTWQSTELFAANERPEYFWELDKFWIITWHLYCVDVIVFCCRQSVNNLCNCRTPPWEASHEATWGKPVIFWINRNITNKCMTIGQMALTQNVEEIWSIAFQFGLLSCSLFVTDIIILPEWVRLYEIGHYNF